jgi:hypothetical protein
LDGPASSGSGKGLRAMAVTLIALVAAGCLGPQDAPSASLMDATPAVTATPTLLNNSSVEAPVWAPGDAWEITTHGVGTGARETLVVASATSDSYLIATTSEQTATFDAAFDVSYVGKIRASDLAGAQKEKSVQFFDFPLTDGKAWSATWDGLKVGISAHFQPSIAMAGGRPGFSIVATHEGKEYATYDYVPALKWWSHLDFAEGYGIKIERATSNWTGMLVTATAKQVYNSETAVPVVTFNTETFKVDERQTTLMLTLGGGAKNYARSWQLIDPNGTTYPSGGPAYEVAQAGGGVFSTYTYPAVPGDWKISAPIAHDNTGSFLLTAHEIALAKKAFP